MSLEIGIDPGLVRRLAEKARAISAAIGGDYLEGHNHEAELDPVTLQDRHHHDGLAEEEIGDLTGEEFEELVGDLNEDEAAFLVAIAWIGRGDFEVEDIETAVEEAKARAVGPTYRYLSGMPLLSDYLESGLDALKR